MKFRSWYIVLLGILAQAGFGLALLSGAETADRGGLVLAIGGIIVLLASALGLIPLLLLVFQKTRKFGAVISIVFGIAGLILQFGIIIGAFLIIAGILSLWRKT